MKSKFFVVFAVCAVLFGISLQLNAQNATPASEFDYYLNADCTGIVISWYNGKAKNVIIPSTIEGYPVEEIGYSAFTDYDLKKILESVTIPDSVKKIGAYAFNGCEKLKTVNIGAKTIEYLEEVTKLNYDGIYPDGNGAFSGCSALSLKEQKKIRETGYKGRF